MNKILKINLESLNLRNLVIITISLFPLFFISGSFLSDFFCIFLGLIFLYKISKEKKWNELYFNYYFFYFILIFFYLNLNSYFSFNKEISFSKSLPFIRIVIFIFALSFFLNKYNKIYNNFFYCFVFLLVLMFLDSLIQVFFNYTIFGTKIILTNRISSFFGDEMIMGSYITRLLPIITAIPLLMNFKKKYLINFFVLIVSSILVFLSAERLSMFYLVSFLVFYFLITKRFFFKFIFLFFIGLFFINLYNPSFSGRIIGSTIKQFNQTESITSYRHLLHYKTAFDMFMDKKITGHGLKAFRYICSKEKYVTQILKKQNEDIKKKGFKTYLTADLNGCNTHPHNIYLEFLSELGLVGFLLFLVIFLYSVINILNFLKKKYFVKIKVNDLLISKNLILFGIFIQMFPLVPSGSFFNNYMLIIFHISIGFYLSISKNKE